MIDETSSSATKDCGDSTAPTSFDEVQKTNLDRADWLSLLITTVFVLVAYLFTLAPEVTLGFAGIFSTAAMHGGVPHPPGYLLSTLYGWAFVHLVPISNVAWRMAAASAIAGALACGVIAVIVSRLGTAFVDDDLGDDLTAQKQNITLRVAAGWTAGAVFGFSDGFWNRAVIADVWTLSTLSLCLVLYFLLRWTQAPDCKRHLYFAFLTYGLALTNSQALLIIAPAIPFVVMTGSRDVGRDLFLGGVVLCTAVLIAAFLETMPELQISRDGLEPLLAVYIIVAVIVFTMTVRLSVATRRICTEWKTVAICCAFLLAGLSLYFYVPIVSMTNPPMNWGYPRTVQGFFHVLSRGQYERIHLPADIDGCLKALWFYVTVLGSSFGWVSLGIALVPFAFSRKIPVKSRESLLALGAAFLCLGPLLITILNPYIGNEGRWVVQVFGSLSGVVLAIWMGCGLVLVGRWVVKRSRLQ
jgi:hypothetical protein